MLPLSLQWFCTSRLTAHTSLWQCFWWKCEHCEVWEIIITMNYGKMENLSSGLLWWFGLMGPPLRDVFVCIRFSVGPSSLWVDQQGGSFMIVSKYMSQGTKKSKGKEQRKCVENAFISFCGDVFLHVKRHCNTTLVIMSQLQWKEPKTGTQLSQRKTMTL